MDLFKSSNHCICERGKKLVHRSACGFIFDGRIRKQCFQHPNRSFLMDSQVCSRCHDTTKLLEFDFQMSDLFPELQNNRVNTGPNGRK